MNKHNAGWSPIGYIYNIPGDKDGNSVLTGDGGRNNDERFTVVELEVFKVT